MADLILKAKAAVMRDALGNEYTFGIDPGRGLALMRTPTDDERKLWRGSQAMGAANIIIESAAEVLRLLSEGRDVEALALQVATRGKLDRHRAQAPPWVVYRGSRLLTHSRATKGSNIGRSETPCRPSSPKCSPMPFRRRDAD